MIPICSKFLSDLYKSMTESNFEKNILKQSYQYNNVQDPNLIQYNNNISTNNLNNGQQLNQ